MYCSIRSVHLRGTCDLALLIVMEFGISQDYYRNSIYLQFAHDISVSYGLLKEVVICIWKMSAV